MKSICGRLTKWLLVLIAIFLWIRPGLTSEINQKTSKGNIEMEIRWTTGAMKTGCYVEQGNVRLAGEMKSDNDTVYLLFVDTTIRNNRDKTLKFSLKDFRIKVGDRVLTPSAYLVNTPVFVATSENAQFEIKPKEELKMGVGFAGISKAITNLNFIFLDLPEISFTKPPKIENEKEE